MEGSSKSFSLRRKPKIVKEMSADFFINNPNYMWHGPSANSFIVKEAPPNIRYIPNFITDEEEKLLLAEVYSAPKPKWQQLMNRRLQNWGGVLGKEYLIPDSDMPLWLNFIIDKVMTVGDSFPCQNRPNHVLVNEYLPGQGIMGHTDGPAFYPLVATISMGSDLLVDYYVPPNRNSHDTNALLTPKDQRYIGSMLLEQRSLLLVSDDAYTAYLHEIAERPFDVITNRVFNLEGTKKQAGEVMNRELRVSLTIRNVPKVSKMTTADLVVKH